MSIAAYQTRVRDSVSPTEVEYQVLGKMAGRMEKVREGRVNATEFASVIHENRQFWQSLAIDLADPSNQLPDDLKARLISLAIWVTNHSSKVLNEEKSIDALIEINKSVMAGLSGQAAEKRETAVHAIGAGAQA